MPVNKERMLLTLRKTRKLADSDGEPEVARGELPPAFVCASCGVRLEGPFSEWPAHCSRPALGARA
jgi:hypothetical protein